MDVNLGELFHGRCQMLLQYFDSVHQLCAAGIHRHIRTATVVLWIVDDIPSAQDRTELLLYSRILRFVFEDGFLVRRGVPDLFHQNTELTLEEGQFRICILKQQRAKERRQGLVEVQGKDRGRKTRQVLRRGQSRRGIQLNHVQNELLHVRVQLQTDSEWAQQTERSSWVSCDLCQSLFRIKLTLLVTMQFREDKHASGVVHEQLGDHTSQ